MPNKVISYRAIAIGVERDGHAIQEISFQMNDMHEWAQITSKKYNCIVKIFITREFLLKTIKPKYEKKEISILPKLKMCLVCGKWDCSNTSHAEYKGRKPQ